MEKTLLQRALYTKDSFSRRCSLEIKAATMWSEMSSSTLTGVCFNVESYHLINISMYLHMFLCILQSPQAEYVTQNMVL